MQDLERLPKYRSAYTVCTILAYIGRCCCGTREVVVDDETDNESVISERTPLSVRSGLTYHSVSGSLNLNLDRVAENKY